MCKKIGPKSGTLNAPKFPPGEKGAWAGHFKYDPSQRHICTYEFVAQESCSRPTRKSGQGLISSRKAPLNRTGTRL